MMVKMNGEFPKSMVNSAAKHFRKYFDSSNHFIWPKFASSEESEKAIKQMKLLDDLITKEHSELIDLVRKLLTFDPSRRISAKNALQHKFFRKWYGDCL